MPPKGSKAANKKNSFVGENAKNKNKILNIHDKILQQHETLLQQQEILSQQNQLLSEQLKEMKALDAKIIRQQNKIKLSCKKLNSVKNDVPVIALSSAVKNRRLKNPTSQNINLKSKGRRSAETLAICEAIHGGSSQNIEPAIDGMIQTLTSKCKSDWLAVKLLSSKNAVHESIKKRCINKSRKEFYDSKENLLRSLNVYYSQDVMGKRKYISTRHANKAPGVVNFVSYATLANHVRNIDIGEVRNIDPVFTEGLHEDEIGAGMYRNLIQYAPKLAEFYLNVNEKRTDKLKEFTNYTKKSNSSFLFLMAVGGDEAPLSGTTFLFSFLNVGKRIASSFENYIIFGGNVKENGQVVRRYVLELLSQLKYLESEVFTVEMSGKNIMVEFKVESLPNDLKMLAFLAGELTNAAFYFTTFANVNQNDANDINKQFNIDGSSEWEPFNYMKRIKDAAKVQNKKAEIAKKKIKTGRTLLTTYISKELNSRQEEAPLIGKYVNLATCEPLHMKNNTVKELFMKVLNLVLLQSNVPGAQSFSEIDPGNLFVEFINFVRKDMNCNYLAKKLITWFNENKINRKVKDFSFRFRGKESNHYLQIFPKMISLFYDKIVEKSCRIRLLQIFYQSVNLRKVISYSVRIESVGIEDILDMKDAARNLFCSCCLFDTKITPTMWN